MKQHVSVPTIDLTNCEKEPIHIPGSIQPHGLLIVLEEATFTILQISENVSVFLGVPPSAVLNQPLNIILGQEQMVHLRECVQAKDLQSVNPLDFQLLMNGEERHFEGMIHRLDRLLILELEPVQDQEQRTSWQVYVMLKDASSRLQKATNLRDLCQAAAEEMFRLSGFDHVMVYQFDERWNGTVIAEAMQAGIESFLGLRFPASDIPIQARELYHKNLLRLIANVDYQPSPLLPPSNPLTGGPLDMSRSVLRSVSPMHIEYLKNMGISATLAISLISNGTLWGMLVCHHRTPTYPSHSTRYACELLGQIFSSFLVGKEEYDLFLSEWKLRTIEGSLLGSLPREENLVDGLLKYGANVLELVNARGLAINIIDRYVGVGGVHRCESVGQCPSKEDIQDLVAWLHIQSIGAVFITDSLPALYAPAERFSDVASGLLALSLSDNDANYLLWFRPEVVQTVMWGGDPTKPVTVEGKEMRLHPRKSFEAWKQTIRMTSIPWKQNEVEAALHLRGLLVGMAVRDRIVKQQIRSWLDRK